MSRQPPDSDPTPAGRSASPPPVKRRFRRSSLASTAVPPSDSQTPSTSSAPTPSSGVAGGREARTTASRRSARRASVDPYPSGAVRNASPEATSQREVGKAVKGRGEEEEDSTTKRQGTRSHETIREEVMVTEEVVEAAGKETASSEMNYRLVVLQQPEIGAEAGMGKNTLGRLPIVPAPVVEVVVEDGNGARVDREFPFFFCSASLRQADGVSPVDVAPPRTDEDAASDEFSALVGGIVRQSHRIEDLQGAPRDVFVFEDVSVRTQGSYTLEFTLGEAIRPKSPKLAATRSLPFDVVDWQSYPGRPVEDTVPELSLHLRQQGVPMYIPPLLLAQSSDAPPPAGSNPFPDTSASTSATASASEDTPVDTRRSSA